MSANEIWVLGATGRAGRAIAASLLERDVEPVLVGRDRDRLKTVAAGLGRDLELVEAAFPEQTVAALRHRRPVVVVNTVGPFTATGAAVAAACLPGGHYLDLANDILAVPNLLALHERAAAAGSTFITGAGFGFVATEAVVMALCAGRPVPACVRVDAIPSVALEAGALGHALAASIVEGLPAGGRRYAGGRLVRSAVGAEPRELTLPDGGRATTGAGPFGDLHAAWLVSQAPEVLAASSEVPTAAPVRALLPIAGAVARIPLMRRLATRRLAAVRLKARPQPREHSWGRAEIRWSDGTVRTGWLRAGEAMAFTAAIAAETALRLLRGEAAPGAFTPMAAFGPTLATAAGGELVELEGRP